MAGLLTCRFSSLGAAPAPQPAPVAEEQVFSELDFEQLSRIKVSTVARRLEELFTSPAAVTVVRGEEIRRLGVRSIPEALRFVPGVQVARINSQEWAITARGLNRANANKLLVLIDGRTVYSPLFDGVFWDQQEVMLEDVDRIEVVRGPGATQWGANAVNGVVNIVTRRADQTEGTLLVAGGGLEERAFASARHGFALGSEASLRVYGLAFDRDGIELSDGEDLGDDWALGQAGFRMDWDSSPRDTITLQGDAYRGRLDQMPTVFSTSPPFAETIEETVETEGSNLLGRWTHQMEGGSELQTQLYFDRAQRINEPLFGTLDVNTVDLDVQHRLTPSQRWTWTWGFGYRLVWDNLDDRFTVDWTELRRSTSRYSSFIHAEVELVPRLMLSGGSKFELHEYSGFEYQPTLRLAWQLAPDQMLWGAVSMAVRTPSRAEDSEIATVVNPAGPVASRLFGETDLEAERLTAYEMGHRFQVADRFMVDTAVFLNEYEDLVSFRELPFGTLDGLLLIPFTLNNALTGTAYGLEVASRWLPTKSWRLDLAYTLLRDDLDATRTSPVISEESLEADEGKSPVHQWSLGSSHDLPHRWELDADLRYVGRLDTPGVPSYLVGDLRVGWRASDLLEISLTARNIGPEHPEFGPNDSADLVRPEVQSRIFLTTRWRF